MIKIMFSIKCSLKTTFISGMCSDGVGIEIGKSFNLSKDFA